MSTILIDLIAMKMDLFQKVYILTIVYEVKKPSAFAIRDPLLNLKFFDSWFFRKLSKSVLRWRHITIMVFFHYNAHSPIGFEVNRMLIAQKFRHLQDHHWSWRQKNFKENLNKVCLQVGLLHSDNFLKTQLLFIHDIRIIYIWKKSTI